MCNEKECKCGGNCGGNCKCKENKCIKDDSNESKKHLVFYVEFETMILDTDLIGMADNKLSEFIKKSKLDNIDYEFKTIRFNNNLMKEAVAKNIENVNAVYEALEIFEKKYNIKNIADDINSFDEAMEKFDDLRLNLIKSVDGMLILTDVEEDYKPACALFTSIPLYISSLGFDGKLVFI